ncbi:GntR family transcriptional regulator [Marinitoga sp. 1135]|uniref:Putative transcriptional regulator n=1 Tax=Marinitoga piezophila (strain DSM 14283 / JCM 11233 / KA3) TaxID=443254 RepID=H2J2Z8_MARPK|nr:MULTISPECIES: GntR family transcriptional regulator [Marinitoga]AEX85689.1 putative transcriptional regulator [Marinitoga piezophila KA3]APT76140.1 GntR family transcriptional regulator [Marinitoga sp. 1137]NUU95894.1 GntR family transcriptional regulator [Marinitoga sp. 1135]NUU97804.1 GntR family transcriptional regulator [Marinitoga sp. 1138]
MWFSIDFHSHTPVYEQIKNKIKEKILTNELKKDEFIPSIRVLAKELGVNLNTVSRAYKELEFEGVIKSVRGSGYIVLGIDENQFIEKKLENFQKSVLECKNAKIQKEKLISIINKLYDD